MTIKEKILAVLTGSYLLIVVMILLGMVIYDYINKKEDYHIPYFKAHSFLCIKNLTNFFIQVIIIMCIFEKILKWFRE